MVTDVKGLKIETFIIKTKKSWKEERVMSKRNEA